MVKCPPVDHHWLACTHHLLCFVTFRSEYDDGSGTIEPKALEELLLRLEPPLGLGPFVDNKDVLRCGWWCW